LLLFDDNAGQDNLRDAFIDIDISNDSPPDGEFDNAKQEILKDTYINIDTSNAYHLDGKLLLNNDGIFSEIREIDRSYIPSQSQPPPIPKSDEANNKLRLREAKMNDGKEYEGNEIGTLIRPVMTALSTVSDTDNKLRLREAKMNAGKEHEGNESGTPIQHVTTTSSAALNTCKNTSPSSPALYEQDDWEIVLSATLIQCHWRRYSVKKLLILQLRPITTDGNQKKDGRQPRHDSTLTAFESILEMDTNTECDYYDNVGDEYSHIIDLMHILNIYDSTDCVYNDCDQYAYDDNEPGNSTSNNLD